MKRISFFGIALLGTVLCIGAALAAEFDKSTNYPPAATPESLELIHKTYGPDVARLYRAVKGLPIFHPKVPQGLRIRHKQDRNPCSQIFLRENPEMAEDCMKVRETLTYITRHKKRVKAHIKDGKLVSVSASVALDPRNPMKSRSFILLHDALVLHDSVLERYSQNHAKIYHFPTVTPVVEIDRAHNLIFRFGQEYIKLRADNFRHSECEGFEVNCRPKFYRNGSRSIPDVAYTGGQPHLVAVNWSYPPLNGSFTLYDGHSKLGTVPARLLYQKLEHGRARPLFKKNGLMRYLAQCHDSGRIKALAGNTIHKFVARLVERCQGQSEVMYRSGLTPVVE